MASQGEERTGDKNEAASKKYDNAEATLSKVGEDRSVLDNHAAEEVDEVEDAGKSAFLVEEGAQWFLNIKDLWQDKLTSPLDLFSIYLHGFMLELGFKGDLGSASWKGPVGYVTRYSLFNASSTTAVSLTITTMGPVVKVHGVHPDLKTSFSTSKLRPKDFISSDQLETRNLGLLAREFKNQIGVPLLNSARSHLGLVQSGLEGLPPELLQRILHLLPFASVLRLSSVSRSLNAATQDETLWRRLFLKSFGKAKTTFKERSCSSEEDGVASTWKQMFREEESARRERARREEEMRGRRPFDLHPPPLFPFPDPNNPLGVQPPPQGGFPGILGGDYDRYPGGLPGPGLPLFGGHTLRPQHFLPRPRFDPPGPGRGGFGGGFGGGSFGGGGFGFM